MEKNSATSLNYRTWHLARIWKENQVTLKWYYDQKSPYLFFLHFESLNYKFLPCQILGHDFDGKSDFLNDEFSIRLPAIIQFKNGRLQMRVGSRKDVTSSYQDI